MSESVVNENENDNNEVIEVVSISGLERHRKQKAEKKQKRIQQSKHLSQLRREKQANGHKSKPIRKSARAGVIFPVTRIVKKLKSIVPQKRNRLDASIYLTAVLEYLCAEVLELAGNCATEMKKLRISPRHILLATKEDPELAELLKNVLLSNGGVVPSIHPNLLLPLKSDWPKELRSKSNPAKETVDQAEDVVGDSDEEQVEIEENLTQEAFNEETPAQQENEVFQTETEETEVKKSETEERNEETEEANNGEVESSNLTVQHKEQENDFPQSSDHQIEYIPSSNQIEKKSPNKRTRSVSNESDHGSPSKKSKVFKEIPETLSQENSLDQPNTVLIENVKSVESPNRRSRSPSKKITNSSITESQETTSQLNEQSSQINSSNSSTSTCLIDENQTMSPSINQKNEAKVGQKRPRSPASASSTSRTPITTRSNKKIQMQLDKAKKSFEKSIKILENCLEFQGPEDNDENSSELSSEMDHDTSNQKENIVEYSEDKTEESTTTIVKTKLADITNKMNH